MDKNCTLSFPPLFLIAIVEALLEQSLLAKEGGDHEGSLLRTHLSLRMPDTLRQLLTQQSATVSDEERQVLEAGSVVGEIGLYLGQPRSASVVTDQAIRVYCLSLTALEDMHRETPATAAAKTWPLGLAESQQGSRLVQRVC